MTGARGTGRHLAEYVGVAGLATAADVGTVYAGRWALHLPLLLAVASGFAANVLVGFVLQHTVVFRDSDQPVRRSSWRYAALVASNVVIGVGGVTVVVGVGVPYLVARLGSSAVIVALNYVVLRWWVFPAAVRV